MVKFSGIKCIYFFKLLFFSRFILLSYGNGDSSFIPQPSASNSNTDASSFLNTNRNDLIFLNIMYVYNDGGSSHVLRSFIKYAQNHTTPYIINKLLDKYVFGNYNLSDCRFNVTVQKEKVVKQKEKVVKQKELSVLNKYISLYRQHVKNDSTIIIEVKLPFPVLQDECNYSSFIVTNLDNGKNLRDNEAKEKMNEKEENKFYCKHVCEVEELLKEINSKKNNTQKTIKNDNDLLQISKDKQELKENGMEDKRKPEKEKEDKQEAQKQKKIYKNVIVWNLEKMKDKEIIDYIKVVEAYEPDNIYKFLYDEINNIFKEIKTLFRRVLHSNTYSASCKNINKINDLSYNLAYKIVRIANTKEKKILLELNVIIEKISKYMLDNKWYNNNLYYKPISTSDFLDIKKNMFSFIKEKNMLENINIKNNKVEVEKENRTEQDNKSLKEINKKLLEYLKYIAIEKENSVKRYMKKINLVATKAEKINGHIIKKHIKKLIVEELDSNKSNFVGKLRYIEEQINIIMRKNNLIVSYIDNIYLKKDSCMKEEVKSNIDDTTVATVYSRTKFQNNFLDDFIKYSNNNLLEFNEINNYKIKAKDEQNFTFICNYVCNKAKLSFKKLKFLISDKSLERIKYLDRLLDDNTILCLQLEFKEMHEIINYIKRYEKALNKRNSLLDRFFDEVKSTSSFSLTKIRFLLYNMQKYLPSNNFYNPIDKKMKLIQLEETESKNVSEKNEEKQIFDFKNTIKEDNFNRIYHEEVKTIITLSEFIGKERYKMSKIETDTKEKILLLNNKIHEGNNKLIVAINTFFDSMTKNFIKIDEYFRDKSEILYYMQESYSENENIKMKLSSVFSDLFDLQKQYKNNFYVNVGEVVESEKNKEMHGREKNFQYEEMNNTTYDNFDFLKQRSGGKNLQNIDKTAGLSNENIEIPTNKKNENIVELGKQFNLSTASFNKIVYDSAIDHDILETISDVRFSKVKEMGRLLFYILCVYFWQLELLNSFLNKLCDSEKYGLANKTSIADRESFCDKLKRNVELKSHVIKFAKDVIDLLFKNLELLNGIKSISKRLKIDIFSDHSPKLWTHIFRRRNSKINILFRLLKLEKNKLVNLYESLNNLHDEDSNKTENKKNETSGGKLTSNRTVNEKYLKAQKIQLRCDLIYSIANSLLDKNEKFFIEETKFFYNKKYEEQKEKKDKEWSKSEDNNQTIEQVKFETNEEKTKETKKLSSLLSDEIKIDESQNVSQLLLSKDLLKIEEQEGEYGISDKLDMFSNENFVDKNMQERIMFKTLKLSIDEQFEKIKNNLFYY